MTIRCPRSVDEEAERATMGVSCSGFLQILFAARANILTLESGEGPQHLSLPQRHLTCGPIPALSMRGARLPIVHTFGLVPEDEAPSDGVTLPVPIALDNGGRRGYKGDVEGKPTHGKRTSQNE